MNYAVYIGKEDDQPARRAGDSTHGVSMLLRLVEPFMGKGRNITCDNYFTDEVLTEKLSQKKTTLVGTVRRNKRFLPVKFSGKKQLQLNESVFGFQDNRLIVSYQGHRQKNVFLMSSMHNDAAVDIENVVRRKPEVILFYNQTKGGVDTMDKMALTYTTKRATKRWPMVLFYNLLDISTIAARVIFGLKNPTDELSKKNSRGDFIREISKTLMRDHMIRRQAALVKASRPLKNLFETCLKDMGVNTERPGPANLPVQQGTRKRGRGGMCPWKRDRKGASKCQNAKHFYAKSTL